MAIWTNIIIVVHVLVALAIIGLVLLQHGKGADMGSGFGGGASSSLFGATGSANFLSRTTAVLATVFFLLSLALAYIASTAPRESGSVVDRAAARAQKKEVEQNASPSQDKPAPSAAEAGKAAPPAQAPKDKNVPQ
ncbi:MAG: preprotein translocase subunit SecG [Betaproteobacteria bacterium]|nr:preprotein translocase subunit SecG [Betaproteobacteria bacterium]